jgi:hypothetical protein
MHQRAFAGGTTTTRTDRPRPPLDLDPRLEDAAAAAAAADDDDDDVYVLIPPRPRSALAS